MSGWPSCFTTIWLPSLCCASFFFNDTATTEIYTLSLHDALPIFHSGRVRRRERGRRRPRPVRTGRCVRDRSEEHTSELQSQSNLVFRLLLEKKKPLNGKCCSAPTHSRTRRRPGRAAHPRALLPSA